MKKWLIVLGVVVVMAAGIAVWYRATALAIVTKTIPMAGVESVQCGGDVTLVQDRQDKLVIRTTRRAMPWVRRCVRPRHRIAALRPPRFPARPATPGIGTRFHASRVAA